MGYKLSDVVIRLAESSEDLDKLFKFRYSIYVEEMRRDHKHANHKKRVIEEPFDCTGANFMALDEDRIIGCIRSNCGTDTDFGEFVERYRMQCVGHWFPELCNVNTRLFVAPEYRRTGLMALLACKAYHHVRSKGIICDFIGCAPELERLFTRFGYIPYRENVPRIERDYTPMLLLGVDLEHLKQCRSPLAKIEEQFERLPHVVSYFNENVYGSNSGYFKESHHAHVSAMIANHQPTN